jgi:putative endonuclease
MSHKTYFTYLLTNDRHSVLYIGMTNDLQRRIREHRQGKVEGFTKQYNVKKLLWFEEYGEVRDAIRREKQLKNWRRQWKWDLVREANPELRDLAGDWD